MLRIALCKLSRMAGLLSVVVVVGVTSASAAHAATNFTWSGADTSGGSWSFGDNWGGTSPSSGVGTLSFNDLGGSCDTGSSAAACYASVYDDGMLTAQGLTIDDNSPYVLSAQNLETDQLTLDPASGTNGITATPSANGTGGPAQVLIPLFLQDAQTWEVDGGSLGSGALAVAQAVGAHQLNLDLRNGGTLYTTTLGPLEMDATGDGAIVLDQIPDGGSALTPQLPVEGTTLSDGASLYIQTPDTTSGSITASGSETSQPVISVGAGESPDATLTVNGALTLDQWSNLYFDIDGGASGGFSQLSVNGAVNLSDATIFLDQGWDNNDDSDPQCATLTPGGTFPVLRTYAGFDGDLTYLDADGGFDELGPGETSNPLPISIDGSGCPAATQTAYARLTYESQEIEATVVSHDWAPVNTGLPLESGNLVAGSTLTANPGIWVGSPTFGYQWQRCTILVATGLSCADIPGATAVTYTLTNSDAYDYIRLAVTATDTGQSAVAYGSLRGPVVAAPTPTPPPSNATPTPTKPTAPTFPSLPEIPPALNGLAHPSGKKAIARLLKSGSFKTSFKPPVAGSLSVTWTAIVTTGKGKHRKQITVATGSANANGTRALSLTIRLTVAGKALLKRHATVAATAVEQFKPRGGNWVLEIKRFRL
jgi:hypothetical protein